MLEGAKELVVPEDATEVLELPTLGKEELLEVREDERGFDAPVRLEVAYDVVEPAKLVVPKDDGRELEPPTAENEELKLTIVDNDRLEPPAVHDGVLVDPKTSDEELEMPVVEVGGPVGIDNAGVLEVPAVVETLEDNHGVVESSLAETTKAEVDNDGIEVDITVGDTPVVADPAEDESVDPEPAREDDAERAMEDVNV